MHLNFIDALQINAENNHDINMAHLNTGLSEAQFCAIQCIFISTGLAQLITMYSILSRVQYRGVLFYSPLCIRCSVLQTLDWKQLVGKISVDYGIKGILSN